MPSIPPTHLDLVYRLARITTVQLLKELQNLRQPSVTIPSNLMILKERYAGADALPTKHIKVQLLLRSLNNMRACLHHVLRCSKATMLSEASMLAAFTSHAACLCALENTMFIEEEQQHHLLLKHV